MREKSYYCVRVTDIPVKGVCGWYTHVKRTSTCHLTQHPKRNNITRLKKEKKQFPFVSCEPFLPDTDLTQNPVRGSKVNRKFLNERGVNCFLSLLETQKTPYTVSNIGFYPVGWLMCVR